MSQQEMISTIVRQVIQELNTGNGGAAPASAGGKLNYKTDYPLSEKRRELVKTASGKSLDDITLDAVMKGEIKAEEIRITPQMLEYQAQVAESIGRPQFAGNLRRAGELTKVPDERILEMYNALRPHRSSKEELLAMAEELENQYGAKVCGKLVREAAHVYEKRGRLRED